MTGTDLAIVVSAVGIVSLFLGYLWGHAAGSRPWREEQRDREIERRLLGREAPKHRATAPSAVVRAARVTSTKAWLR